MSKHYYKRNKKTSKRVIRALGAVSIFGGVSILFYVFFPFLSWQIYFAPVFAQQNIETPIPKTTVVSTSSIENLLTTAVSSFGVDYTNANNWYPKSFEKGGDLIAEYLLSIPSIGVKDAIVSTKDPDLSKHMIQYNNDSIPPLPGNSIIFGHSTLPQLYDPNDYKTILANAYKIAVGDEITVGIDEVRYKYKVVSIRVVEPNDTSVLAQNFSDSFITIITCTPPGTIWKRLIIKAQIENINGSR